jgi:hypothetical protein
MAQYNACTCSCWEMPVRAKPKSGWAGAKAREPKLEKLAGLSRNFDQQASFFFFFHTLTKVLTLPKIVNHIST